MEGDVATVSDAAMRFFLGKSLAGLNMNKLRGVFAEVSFRERLQEMGFGTRVGPGGWVLRKTRKDFGSTTVVVFPEVVDPGRDYSIHRECRPPEALHTVCATFHQTGLHAFYCTPVVQATDDAVAVKWNAVQLGIPVPTEPMDLREMMSGRFESRTHAHNYLRWNTDCGNLPLGALREEFSKENLRVYFSTRFYAEVSDIDGLLWGQQYTYPIEIKEKTVATDKDIGDWFGLDIGPFVKLAYYAAKRGNLHSIFVVREIDDVETRRLKEWWYITFEDMAKAASWLQQGGGQNMIGGRSAVVRVPKAAFKPLTHENLERL